MHNRSQNVRDLKAEILKLHAGEHIRVAQNLWDSTIAEAEADEGLVSLAEEQSHETKYRHVRKEQDLDTATRTARFPATAKCIRIMITDACTSISNSNLSATDEVKPTPYSIRDALSKHLASIGLARDGARKADYTKSDIQNIYSFKREERDRHEKRFIEEHADHLITNFADGSEVEPALISAELVPVTKKIDADLFRFATCLWSVPVSRGFGRRIRFLVRDLQNGKLIGLLALGSPVFNLAARDEWIGWSVRDRERRLTRVMDAYVLGAVEPYASLLGGKLVGALVASDEVADHFAQKYRGLTGRISGRVESPELALVTTTSALGRSSVYNRLRLMDVGGTSLVRFEPVGFTAGFGHFHIPDPLFEAMRQLLIGRGRTFASCSEYGSGPNRRLRILREGLEAAGMDATLARHGVQREVFCIPTVPDWRDLLLGHIQRSSNKRPSVERISHAAVERWVIPRARRRPSFRTWTREDLTVHLSARFEINIPGFQRAI